MTHTGPNQQRPKGTLMERINELLALGVETLTDEQLTELSNLLLDEFNTANDAERTAEVVAQMATIVESLNAVSAEQTSRSTAQAELDAQAEALAAQVAEMAPAAGPEDEEPEEPEAPAEEPEDAAAEVPAEEPVPVTAAAIPVVPRRMRPRPTPDARPDQVILAAGDVPGHSSGDPLTIEQLGQAFYGKSRNLGRGGRAAVARIERNMDGPLVMPGPYSGQNSQTITAAMEAHKQRLQEGFALVASGGSTLNALTASGGICAPPTPVYTFQNIASTARPIAAALARVNATRGGVTWMPPIQIVETNTGIAVWTAENDETPSSPTTKPCVRIDCDATTSVNVDAITLCVEMGNLERIFFEERFNDIWAKAQAQHARIAERNLLTYMRTNSVAVTDAVNLGASRDLLESWIRLAAAERNRQRQDPMDPVIVVTSAWVRDAIRADLLRQLPGDQAFSVADAYIDQAFANANILPVFTYEWPAAGPNDFAAQIAGGTLNRWPSTVESLVFHVDAHFMLDGGELNLGTEIRDSTLNSTNDVNAWLETFEAAGFNGLWSYRLTNTICVTGETAATVDVSCTGS